MNPENTIVNKHELKADGLPLDQDEAASSCCRRSKVEARVISCSLLRSVPGELYFRIVVPIRLYDMLVIIPAGKDGGHPTYILAWVLGLTRKPNR